MRDPEEVDSALAVMTREAACALSGAASVPSPSLTENSDPGLCRKNAAACDVRTAEDVDAGGLTSYGVIFSAQFPARCDLRG